jgi:hypothetical protein
MNETDPGYWDLIAAKLSLLDPWYTEHWNHEPRYDRSTCEAMDWARDFIETRRRLGIEAMSNKDGHSLWKAFVRLRNSTK